MGLPYAFEWKDCITTMSALLKKKSLVDISAELLEVVNGPAIEQWVVSFHSWQTTMAFVCFVAIMQILSGNHTYYSLKPLQHDDNENPFHKHKKQM